MLGLQGAKTRDCNSGIPHSRCFFQFRNPGIELWAIPGFRDYKIAFIFLINQHCAIVLVHSSFFTDTLLIAGSRDWRFSISKSQTGRWFRDCNPYVVCQLNVPVCRHHAPHSRQTCKPQCSNQSVVFSLQCSTLSLSQNSRTFPGPSMQDLQLIFRDIFVTRKRKLQ